MGEARPLADSRNDASLIGGRFRIQSTVAQGGMGTVYSVIDERTGEQLALKRMRGRDKGDNLSLFEREYRTLAAIAHPRIVRVFDYGVDAGEPYYTMELMRGRDVQQLAPVPFAEACRYLRDIATCLALLHTRRLLHRDIAPRNVRVTPDGHCKLLDFGALTSFGIPDRLVGTPPCVPPEVLRGAPLDQRADLYSFGALAYFMLTGRHAFPARELDALPELWKKRPSPPSKVQPELPQALDRLVLGLLQLDPAARPSSIAEVVERLTVIGALPPEDEAAQHALADSYLTHVQFVGRERPLALLREQLTELQNGRGASTLIEGDHGVGRTRLLQELFLHARVLGVLAISVDASMRTEPRGTAIALLDELLTESPAALRTAEAHSELLAQLDPQLAAHLKRAPAAPTSILSGDWRARAQEVMHDVIEAAVRATPLLIVVDNVDEADEASVALLAALQQLAAEAALGLVCSARAQAEGDTALSYSRRVLSERSQRIGLPPLAPADTFELARSVFGEAPGLAGFAQWLNDRSAGRPLHCMELLRRLHARGIVRYEGGLWQLPIEPPDAAIAGALDELLTQRLGLLSKPAYSLAEALAVQHSALSRQRVALLARTEDGAAYALIEELLRADVLIEGVHGYRFTHGVLRDLLLSSMPAARKRELHLRCAELRLQQAHEAEATMAHIEAGWHLMHAGEESRGADLLADVAYDTLGARFAFADLQIAAPALEAALRVYTREGRSPYERLLLLSALAQAGYYEARTWGERYGDEALAAALDLSGVGVGVKLARYLGKTPGLLVGVLWGLARFVATPRRLRRYPFKDILVQLFGIVTTVVGMYVTALDRRNADRFARVLEPFAHLPEKLTATGIYQFAIALNEITRENEVYAISIWTKLLSQFEDRTFYRALPDRTRPPYVGGLLFARGVFEAFRDGRGALDAAEQLDRSGLKFNRMIASQIRVLYHDGRGEIELARRQRRQLELHVLQIGSASQIELWAPAAAILAVSAIGDLVEMRRIADRLGSLAQRHSSLELYAEVAEVVYDYIRYIPSGPAELASLQEPARKAAESVIDRMRAVIASVGPRGAIGWGALSGMLVKALNALGRHGEAVQDAERTLAILTPEDREFTALFLGIEIELAVAYAGLGKHAPARARLDELLAFHEKSDNPLTRGRIHDGYARAAAHARDWSAFRHHIEETRSWYRNSGANALLARVEVLSGLEPWHSSQPPPPRPSPADDASSEVQTVIQTPTATDATTRALPLPAKK